ncbi:MAG: AAA family ATPase [Candidatus Saccharibacteria bacterium]|nr:AAA family ATPase [Candidatus Saccharibacteria bacterium]
MGRPIDLQIRGLSYKIGFNFFLDSVQYRGADYRFIFGTYVAVNTDISGSECRVLFVKGAILSQITCRTDSIRAKKARVGALLDKKSVRLPLVIAFGVLVLLWILHALVYPHYIAHVWAAGIVVPGLLLGWYYGELVDLPTSTRANTNDVSNRLDRHILGQLKNDHSLDDLLRITFGSTGGRFFINRYLLFPEHIKPLLEASSVSLENVWALAAQLADERNAEEISDAIVAAALVLAIPDHNAFLAHIELDADDIQDGINWHAHLRGAIEHHLSKREVGGIGRDLSFGWAPLLNKVGHNISDTLQRTGFSRRTPKARDMTISQIMHVLARAGSRNVAMIGDVGVGKTTLVHALADKLLENPKTAPEALRYRQVIELDASHIISNAQGRGQTERLMTAIFNEAIKVKNVILFFDNAELFFKEGTGSVDLSSVLLPVLQGGSLQVVFSLNDQQWQRISQEYPELSQLLNKVIVKSLNKEDTLRVMQDEVLLLEAKYGVTYTYRALREAYKLSQRYIRDQAFPGKAIKLLDSATGFTEQKHFVTARSVSAAIEKTYDVKVQTASSAEEKDKLLNIEQKIHERMVNQSRAVKLVSDSLRRARTGVRSQEKPIGTFLFLGPTGVGKTELSKSLAAVYFGGEDRLLRIDMNEFSQPTDTSRLLANAASDPHGLVAQITKQPFSVLLIDEIEKAHPNVLNMLLQMLDEGVLRDNDNKPVSFKDAIIIATSNAGADKIRDHIDAGKSLTELEEPFVNELIDSKLFKPELLNRFDEIILFRPLTPEELLQVVDLLLDGLNKRLESQKVSVTLTAEAKQLLVNTGYDPRLGARPLRRTVQRAVENLVSQRMLGSEVAPGSVMEIDATELSGVLEDRS